MALPCLGYLFESDSVCMCCTSCLYPLIRDRCEPLGSHQERKKLHPPFLFPPPRFSRSLFPAKELRHIALLPCVLPCKGHITHSCQRAEEGICAERKSEHRNQPHGQTREKIFFFFWEGGVFHQSERERKGRHQSTLWVTELKLRRS